MPLNFKTPLVASLLIAAALLSACGKTDTTPGQKVDSAVASTERAASAVSAEVKEAANEVKASTKNVSGEINAKTLDGVITTKVNAALVKDPSLSALKINVDTTDARVALSGTAPSESARERATALAGAVEGVKNVDNRLVVDAKK